MQKSLARISSTSLTMSQLRKMNPQRLTIRNERYVCGYGREMPFSPCIGDQRRSSKVVAAKPASKKAKPASGRAKKAKIADEGEED